MYAAIVFVVPVGNISPANTVVPVVLPRSVGGLMVQF